MIASMSLPADIDRYRALAHIRDTGGSLDIDEVLSLVKLESRLLQQDKAAAPTFTAILSTHETEHCVQLDHVGPEVVARTDGLQIQPGTTVGVRIDDSSKSHSFRFRATVRCMRRAADHWEYSLSFIGLPVLLRWGHGRRASDTVVELENTLHAA